MYARFVTGHIKPGKFELATQMLEKKVIPLLKEQPGFRDEVSFFDKEKNEAFAISFWDQKLDLENYERDIYPKVKDEMAVAFEELPMIRNCEIANSTWYKIHAV